MSFLLAGVIVLASAADLQFPDEFEPWVEEDGIAVKIARTEDSDHPWIRATYEIPVDASTIAGYLCDFDYYDAMFKPGVKKVDVLADGKDCTARLHIVWNFPFPFRNRDGIVNYHSERPDESTFVLDWYGKAEPDDPSEGVRIESIRGQTRVESLGPGKSRVTYQYYGDLGGKFPDWLKEAAWKGEPSVYFGHLRKGMGLGEVGEPWPDDAAARALERLEKRKK